MFQIINENEQLAKGQLAHLLGLSEAHPEEAVAVFVLELDAPVGHGHAGAVAGGLGSIINDKDDGMIKKVKTHYLYK